LAQSLSGIGLKQKNEIIKQYELSKTVREQDNKKSQQVLDEFLTSNLDLIKDELLQGFFFKLKKIQKFV
jgi:hypothetical protein